MHAGFVFVSGLGDFPTITISSLRYYANESFSISFSSTTTSSFSVFLYGFFFYILVVRFAMLLFVWIVIFVQEVMQLLGGGFGSSITDLLVMWCSCLGSFVFSQIEFLFLDLGLIEWWCGFR